MRGLRSLIATIALPAMLYLNSFGAEIESKNYFTQARDKTPIEIKSYSTKKDNPSLVYATFLGNNGDRNKIIDALAEKYNIITFAPRNSGTLTNQSITIDNYVSDLEDTIKMTQKETGQKPYGFGMSGLGGYALALLTTREPMIKRAVLAAPMLNLLEQAPKEKIPWATKELEKEIPGWVLRFACACACEGIDSRGMKFGTQRFYDTQPGKSQIYELFRTALKADKVEKTLKVPTKVILAKIDFFGEDIREEEIKRLKTTWGSLGAETTVMQSNHWFGCNDDEEVGFKGKEAGKMFMETGEIKDIFRFLESK